MKKFLLTFIVILLCAVTVLSGCNLVQTDSLAYAEGVCAEVDGVTVTRRELVNYYISAQNSGYSFEVDELLEEIIKQKLIIREVTDNLEEYVLAIQNKEEMPQENKGLIAEADRDAEHILYNLKNKYYYNQIMQKVFDALDSEILEYENSIRAVRGDKKLEIKEDEEITPDYKPEELYETAVKYEDGDFVKYFEKTDFEAVAVDYTSYVYTSDGYASDQTKAYDRFISGLIRNEKGKGLDTDPDNVFKREVERLYRIYEDQELQNLFKERYLRSLSVETKAVVTKYKELVQNSYSKIVADGATEEEIRAAYVKAMKDSASTTYYHPYANTEKGYIKVAHILIKFTDAQVQELKTILEIEDATEREDAYNAWKERCYGKERYTTQNEDKDQEHYAGNEFGDDILYYSTDVNVTTIDSIIRQALEGKTVQQRAEIFNDLIYKYGQDSGMLNATDYYTVSIDTSIYDDTNKEGLEKAFADEARRLYSEQGAGAVSGPIYVNQYIDDDGNYTSNGNYAGYHFIMVIGEYENLFEYTEIEDIDTDEKYMTSALKMFNTRVMLGVEEKSIFDQVYDSLVKSDYQEARNNKVDTIMNGKSITYDKAYYQDLLDANN